MPGTKRSAYFKQLEITWSPRFERCVKPVGWWAKKEPADSRFFFSKDSVVRDTWQNQMLWFIIHYVLSCIVKHMFKDIFCNMIDDISVTCLYRIYNISKTFLSIRGFPSFNPPGPIAGPHCKLWWIGQHRGGRLYLWFCGINWCITPQNSF